MINRVILRGYVGDDPLIRATEGGKFARLRIATIERILHHETQQQREHTEWHTINLWGEMAERADKELRIGFAVELEGRLRTREWDGKDGTHHRTCEITADSLTLLPTIEGYEIPRPIVERMEQLYPTKKRVPPTLNELKAPATDPDDLPF